AAALGIGLLWVGLRSTQSRAAGEPEPQSQRLVVDGAHPSGQSNDAGRGSQDGKTASALVPGEPPQSERVPVSPDSPAAHRASAPASSSRRSGLAIAGKVVDDLGAPVPEFAIEVRRPGESDSTFPNVTGLDEETRSTLRKLLQKRGELPASEDTDPLVRKFDA